MSFLPEEFTNVIPIDIKKRGTSVRDIPPFPCDPKTLAKIAKIAAIEDNDLRAEHCVFAAINADHESGRKLLRSCIRDRQIYQDLCRLRLEMFLDLRRLEPTERRRQFSILVDGELQSVFAGHRVEYLDDRLYLLCNFIRNDLMVMPVELCNTLKALFVAAGQIDLQPEYGVSNFAEAARWVRAWLEPFYATDYFGLLDPVT